MGLVTGRRLPNGYCDSPPEAPIWLQYVHTAQKLGFSQAETAQHGEDLRNSPCSADALSALLAEKFPLIDARMAELTALRADLETRVGTGYPLRAAQQVG
ncbi:MerR family DNA-binding protein [Streptomyces sp. NPDC007063]|uniref:MerR family DNA-binding protein n=1 Tax=Streptomyces sp. NPDC007063 TaxID=3364772 RepID=UPI0036A9EB09